MRLGSPPPEGGTGCTFSSEKIPELTDRQSGLAHETAERAAGNLTVVWHGQAPVRRIAMPENDVASGLVVDLVA